MAFETEVFFWYLLMVVFVSRVWSVDLGAGLTLSFLLKFWMDYGLGALLYISPWVELPDLPAEHLGFTEVFWASISLFVGWFTASLSIPKTVGASRYTVDVKLPIAYISLGVFNQLILTRTIGKLPSINALVASANSLIVVGMALWCWQAFQDGGRVLLIRRFSLTLLLPAFSLLGQGFMSFGTSALMVALMFVAQIYRPRRHMIVAFSCMVLVGLSFYVNYMRDRNEIRMLVWGGADFSERMARVWETVSTTQMLDLSNSQHVEAINDRINQTVMLGTAVAYLNSNDAFLGGSTIVDGLLAVIPRALWPNKPMSAGSMGLVGQMTGIDFAAGTSVGIGFVMELYGNFGRWGVVLGYALFGFALHWLDVRAGRFLREQDWLGFCEPFLAGLAMVYTVNTIELMMALGGSLGVAYIIRSVLSNYQRLRARIAVWA